MNYKRESQFTNNASKRVFEEVYTNEDMQNNKANVSNGTYPLRVPEMFAANVSQEKAISPRRVMCEPKPHNFITRITFYDPANAAVLGTTDFISFDFTSQNTLEECLNHLQDKLKYTNNGTVYGLYYKFNKLTGRLLLTAIDNAGNNLWYRFECLDYENYENVWGLFNQIGNPFLSAQNNHASYDVDVLGPVGYLDLNNVWSREPLYVHATFSSSKKHYLCRTGDFWFKPSKYYYDNITNDIFEIYFTTDGAHWIIPYDAVKIIELCFILRQFSRL